VQYCDCTDVQYCDCTDVQYCDCAEFKAIVWLLITS